MQSTMVGFLMVQQAVMPTNVLPAPHGNTMTPDRARLAPPKAKERSELHAVGDEMKEKAERYPLPNILLRLFSW